MPTVFPGGLRSTLRDTPKGSPSSGRSSEALSFNSHPSLFLGKHILMRQQVTVDRVVTGAVCLIFTHGLQQSRRKNQRRVFPNLRAMYNYGRLTQQNDVNWHADGLEPLLFSYQIVPFRPFPTATMSAVEFKGYALTDTKKWSDLKVVEFKPKTFLEDDVELRITHCGVCDSDVHTLSQGWGETTNLPLIVGHEIVGVVIRVGSNVTEFKPGERVGIGAQIGSCMKCQRCKHDQENYCREIIYTYNASYPDGVATQGGYSTAIRAHQQFVFAIPDALESRYAASMLCAGLTMFAPLKLNGAGPGKKVGIIGIGGLGHYGILFAKALGAEVYAFTHSPSKIEDAKKMGADHVIDTGASDFHEPLYGELDLIVTTLDNSSPDRPLQTYTSMLRVFGKLVNVGVPDADNLLPPMHAMSLCFNGAFFSGSHLGSKVDCNDMLKLAAEKGVKPWIQELPMS